MCVVLVPIFYYAVFLQDLLLFKLDQYETVSSSPWDGHLHDYQKENFANKMGLVSGQNASDWADHTSASRGGSDSNGLGNIAVYANWKQPLNCDLKDIANDGDGDAIKQYYPNYHESKRNGSYVWCAAQKSGSNKFLPNKFLNIGTGAGEGGWAQALVRDKNEFELEGERFAVLHNTWPVNDQSLPRLEPTQVHKNEDYIRPPGRVHQIFDRAALFYHVHKSSAGPDTVGAGSDVLSQEANTDRKGDHTPSPAMHWDMDNPRERLEHYSSAWTDSRKPGNPHNIDQPGHY